MCPLVRLSPWRSITHMARSYPGPGPDVWALSAGPGPLTHPALKV